ncbi:MAG: transcription termination factor Rho [Kiritimatiellia bacterium]|jgi:transcription termination factor Rho
MTEADQDLKLSSSTTEEAPEEPVKRPRGRPRKTPAPAEDAAADSAASDAPVKRPRGRPRKTPAPAEDAAADSAASDAPVKRPRGRPRKAATPVEDDDAVLDLFQAASKKSAASAIDDSPGETAAAPPADDDEVQAKPSRASAEKAAESEEEDDELISVAGISEEEIRARQEAAKAIVENIGRLKTDMKAVDSYIVAPTAIPAAPAPTPRRAAEFPDRPLSRNDYILQRRLQNAAKRMDAAGAHASRPVGSPVEAQPTRQMNRRERQRMNQRQRAAAEQGGASAPAVELSAQRLGELQRLPSAELLAMAEQQGIVETIVSTARPDLVFALLRNHAARGGTVIGEGFLEIGPEGHGFLRNVLADYKTSADDPMVPQQVVRRFGLRPGDAVEGVTRPPTRDQRERRFVITDVTAVNGVPAADSRRVPLFESLVATYPTRRIRLETIQEEIEMRLVDLVAPIGFGQRGLIVAPPRTGKTVIFQKMANAISVNHPEAEIVVLLIDERPEEVTEMKRNTKASVFASTFEDGPERSVQVAEVALDVACRKVERGRDVVILFDSLTRLARACNAVQSSGGKMLSCGVDVNALARTKRFLGMARNIEGGGSLTILATAIVETGSRLDDMVLEEFNGVANMELRLDRQIAKRRIFPSVDIKNSGTCKAELLMPETELELARLLRKAVDDMPAGDDVEFLVNRIRDAETNAQLVASVLNC